MDDLSIIGLYFARDEQAIAETDAKYGRLCRSICRNILRSDEDAEECVNDVYHGLWNAIPPAKPENFAAFLSRIARNLALKKHEALTAQKRAAGELLSIDEFAEILPDESVADGIRDEEIARAISDFLRGEKPSARNVFLRKYYYFDTIAEIAHRYGFTESKVKNMLSRTRNKLKSYLIKEGIEL